MHILYSLQFFIKAQTSAVHSLLTMHRLITQERLIKNESAYKHLARCDVSLTSCVTTYDRREYL